MKVMMTSRSGNGEAVVVVKEVVVANGAMVVKEVVVANGAGDGERVKIRGKTKRHFHFAHYCDFSISFCAI